MANEATLRHRDGEPVPVVLADGVKIEKGTVLQLADNNIASASSGSGDVFGGILAREKIANDGRTAGFPAYRDGIFNLICAAGAVTTGQWVSTSGANLIKTATEAEIAAGKGIGIALEDGTSGANVLVRVGG